MRGKGCSKPKKAVRGMVGGGGGGRGIIRGMSRSSHGVVRWLSTRSEGVVRGCQRVLQGCQEARNAQGTVRRLSRYMGVKLKLMGDMKGLKARLIGNINGRDIWGPGGGGA